MQRFRKTSYRRNLIIIGGGAAGLVAAVVAATLQARVTLIEKHRMGGECLNTACVPSKTLIRAAKLAYLFNNSSRFGFKNVSYDIDFKKVMQRISETISVLAPHDSAQRLRTMGIECLHGEAQLTGPHSVEVNGRVIHARKIIIATGSTPSIPSIPGLLELPYLSSETFWNLDALPRRLLIIGGGAVGCELAQALVRLGSQVSLLETKNTLISNEDNDISDCIRSTFIKENIKVLCAVEPLSLHRRQTGIQLRYRQNEQDCQLEVDQLLLASGRQANSGGFGLEAQGIEIQADCSIAVDNRLRTRQPTLFACGDVTGLFPFTHVAGHQAWYASVNALFGILSPLRIDYSVIPWTIFTDPEVATVGINERQAQERGIPYHCTHLSMKEVDRAHMEGRSEGLIKVLTVPGKDRILGASIVAEHAGELIMEYVSAMRNRYGLKRILETLHPYPSWSDANKLLAGRFRRKHAPQSLLTALRYFHRWRC